MLLKFAIYPTDNSVNNKFSVMFGTKNNLRLIRNEHKVAFAIFYKTFLVIASFFADFVLHHVQY